MYEYEDGTQALWGDVAETPLGHRLRVVGFHKHRVIVRRMSWPYIRQECLTGNLMRVTTPLFNTEFLSVLMCHVYESLPELMSLPSK